MAASSTARPQIKPPVTPPGLVGRAQKMVPACALSAYRMPFFWPMTRVSLPYGVCAEPGTKVGAMPKSASGPGWAGQDAELVGPVEEAGGEVEGEDGFGVDVGRGAGVALEAGDVLGLVLAGFGG